MDLLNSDTTSSNTYCTSDSFYSLETLPPLNFLADATLLFEGHSRRTEHQDVSTRATHRHQRQGSTGAAWSNHESFDLLINAAISEGFYDQNSRLSPPTLGDGLLYGADVSTYVNLVDISQSAHRSSSLPYADDSLEHSAEKNAVDNGLVVCRVENNTLSVDLRQLFTRQLLGLAKTLKTKTSPGSPLIVPVSLKFPNSNINVRFRVDQLWPDDHIPFEPSPVCSKTDAAVPSTSTSSASILIPSEDPLAVTIVNEIKCDDGKRMWKCHLCVNKVYKSRHNLEHHFNRHLRKKPLVCSYCSKSFTQPGHLHCHVIRCHVPKRLECRGCGSKFSCKKLLLTHMIQKCKNETSNFVRCDHCPDSRFESVRQLGEHYQKNFAHYFDATNSASDVDTTKFELSSSEEHYREVETKFVCDVCNAIFVTSRRLNYHKTNVHEKKHICQTCEKCFGKKIRLVQHQKKCTVVKNSVTI